ncbi:MAG: hypothetical protein P4M15_10570 [Alphaproteobacteria bacterium]|nr:hypothetical protein [Alphaproteobacteria bacterium]
MSYFNPGKLAKQVGAAALFVVAGSGVSHAADLFIPQASVTPMAPIQSFQATDWNGKKNFEYCTLKKDHADVHGLKPAYRVRVSAVNDARWDNCSEHAKSFNTLELGNGLTTTFGGTPPTVIKVKVQISCGCWIVETKIIPGTPGTIHSGEGATQTRQFNYAPVPDKRALQKDAFDQCEIGKNPSLLNKVVVKVNGHLYTMHDKLLSLLTKAQIALCARAPIEYTKINTDTPIVTTTPGGDNQPPATKPPHCGCVPGNDNNQHSGWDNKGHNGMDGDHNKGNSKMGGWKSADAGPVDTSFVHKRPVNAFKFA